MRDQSKANVRRDLVTFFDPARLLDRLLQPHLHLAASTGRVVRRESEQARRLPLRLLLEIDWCNW